MKFEPNIDESIYNLGPEMKEEIMKTLADWFRGFDIRTTEIKGLKLLQLDFHFNVNGVDIVYKAGCS